MVREFSEEIQVFLPGGMAVLPGVNTDARVIGIINDDSNEVGAVHLGLVFQIDLPDGCDMGECEDEGRWVHLDEARCIDTGKYESWTGLILGGI